MKFDIMQQTARSWFTKPSTDIGKGFEKILNLLTLPIALSTCILLSTSDSSN